MIKKQQTVKAPDTMNYKTFYFAALNKEDDIAIEVNFTFIVKAENESKARSIAHHKFNKENQQVVLIQYAGELIEYNDKTYRVNIKPEYNG